MVKVKVLFLSSAKSIHTIRWVNSLSSRGHEVHLVYNKDDISNIDDISINVIKHEMYFSGSKGYYLNFLHLRFINAQIKPDIINVHFASGYGTLVRIAKVKPVILNVWGSDVYDFPYKNKFSMRLILRNLKYPSQIASTSNVMARQVLNLLNDDRHRVEITPFGIDLSLFRPSKKIKNENIIIGNVKSLKPVYNIIGLVEAIEELIKNLKKSNLQVISDKIRVHIYGDGIQKREIAELILQKRLDNVIFLMGRISNNKVPSILKNFDIFCATSIKESFGVSLVEAMAMKVPVVATNAEGFAEVINDGVTGIIVKNNDPVEIAKTLQFLILNKEKRFKMGNAGRLRVEKHYDWNKNVKKMEQIYKDVARKK